MRKEDYVKSYNEQEYRTLEIPINPEDPKALNRKGWNTEPTNLNIGKENMYAVVQEDNKIVIDIDDTDCNDVLKDYEDKTLVIETGGGGRHNYFKDISRVHPIKTTKLYKNGKVVGDIKAHMSYVVGCGCSYQSDGQTKSYSQISSTDKILEIDCTIILEILKKNSISPTNTVSKTTDNKTRLQKGNRNNQCFKVACNLFEKENYGFDEGLNFIKTMNTNSEKPLPDSEINTIVKSAWNRIDTKELTFDGEDKIDNVATDLQRDNFFITPTKTEEILIWNGKKYDNLQAESLIREKTEKLIPNCNHHFTEEAIHKIKRQTYRNLEDFDSDPNILTLDNGMLNIEEERLSPHSPKYLTKVLLPVSYQKPKEEINQKTIFEDIEKNLKDTLFWKYLTASFTVEKHFRQKDFETILEALASVFVKRQINSRAFMFLGNGDNGKSVLLGYIEALLGRKTGNVTHIPLHDISEDKYMAADLEGVSANIYSDLEVNELKKTGKLKDIIAGEGLQVQKKYGQPFTLYPFAKMIYSCNRFPRVFDQSEGFFKRWIIIKWERSFGNDPERISDLLLKLTENKDEMNLVFSCLIPLANRLNRLGKFTHDTEWREKQKAWNKNAEPLNFFIENYIIQDEAPNAKKSKIETYKFYKQTMFDLGESPVGMGNFGREFAQAYEEGHSDGVRYWHNIAFRESKDTKMEDHDST